MASIVDQIRRGIADDIVTGRLPPGARLEELALARQFNASRTPVREALRQLSATGLVQIRLRKGVIVTDIDQDELGELFEALGQIEAVCARLAAKRMSLSERKELELLHAESSVAMTARDRDAYAVLNHRFHRIIAERAHNRPLRDTAEALALRLQPYRNAAFRSPSGGAGDRIESSFREHAAIVAAILAEDAAAAEEGMRQHIASSSLSVLGFYLRVRAAGDGGLKAAS
ncbi:MAG: GntR family transcriptional regulator [Thalassobaculales bacterium]